MTTVCFRVDTLPIPQPRGRPCIVGDGSARVIVDRKHKVGQFKSDVRSACYLAFKGPPLTGPLRFDLDVILPRPKRLIWKTRPMPRQWHDGPKDCDNLLKSTLDSLAGLLFVNDGQCCWTPVRKFIAAGDESPHVLITVATLDDVCP